MSKTIDERLKNSAFNLMNIRLQECLLNLINDLCEHTTGQKDYTEVKEIAEIKLEFFSLVKELSSEMDKKLGERDDYLNKLEDINEKLIKEARPIFLFDKNISYAAMMITEALKLEYAKEVENRNFDIDSVLMDCESYLESADDKLDGEYNRAQLLGCFPHYATKAAFEDYLSRSLNLLYTAASKEFLDTSVEIIKSDLAPFEIVDISDSFPLMSDEVKEIWNMDLKDKTKDELEELLSTLDDTRHRYDTICSDYNMLYNNINFLIAIARYCTDKEQLFEDDFELKDLFYSSVELIGSPNAEAFSETIVEAAEKRIEDIFEKAEKENEKFTKLVAKVYLSENQNRDEIDISDDTNIFINLMGAITELYTNELEEEITGLNILNKTARGAETKYADKEDVEKAINEIIEFSRELSKKYPVAKYRIIKQEFIKHVPSPYSNEEVMNYVKNSIDVIKGKDAFCVALNNLGILLNEIGYFSDDEEDLIHSHEHGDSCGCGHHHHHHDHGDDCGCGHHHHHHDHEDSCGCGHHH